MANLSNINNKFLVTTGGNVLIGATADVSGKLQITGTARIAANASYYSDRTYLGDTWEFASDTTDGVTFKITGGDATTTGNYFRFQTQAGGATPATALTINKDLSATFAGKVTSDALELDYNTSYYNQDKTISAYSASNYVYVNGIGGASGQGLRLNSEGAATNIIGLENSNNSIFFNTNSTLALTLDSSQNATFAGTVETTTLRTDVVNNKANSANIIYRSGTDTLVGGGSASQKLYIQDGGNVGIGTSSPDRLLDVSGTGNVYAKIQSTNSTAAGIELDTNGASIENWLIQADEGIDGLAIYDLGRTAYRMVIDSSGNVGIGVTTVTAGSGWNRVVEIHAAGGTGSHISLTDSTSGTGPLNGTFFGHYSADTYLINREAGNILFWNNGSERMRIDSAGNVGIGTTVATGGFNVNRIGSDGYYNMSNTDSGNYKFTNPGGRLLTSNESNWVADGRDPVLTLASAGNSNATTIGYSIGLNLYSNTATDNTFSPLIAFSNLSNSTSYATAYGCIMGKKTGQGTDSNWSTGEIQFYTAGTKQNGTAGKYLRNTPDFKIDSAGEIHIDGGRILSSGGIYLGGSNNNSNLLDDYEEGTWTPTMVSGGTVSGTMTGKYTKIGRQVTVYGTGVYTAITGDVTLGGLPFTNGNLRAATVNAHITVGASAQMGGTIQENGTQMSIPVTGTYSGGGISFYFGGTYFV